MKKENAITRLVKDCLEDDVLKNQKIATNLRRNIVYLPRIRKKIKNEVMHQYNKVSCSAIYYSFDSNIRHVTK